MVEFICEALEVTAKLPDDSFDFVPIALRCLLSPSAPPDLLRAFREALKYEYVRKPETAAALLSRLALHAALYEIPDSDTPAELMKKLSSVGALLGVDPHALIQAEPDSAHYEELQRTFYPAVANYQSEQDLAARLAMRESVPFHLLLPPIQRSLGAFLRIADVHHGFGVHAIPSRRTPDGEAPLLVRFGLGHGKVFMLNTDDNRRFPGKGFGITGVDPLLLFPARPQGPQARRDPLMLYRQAWPSLSSTLDRLAQAQFIFTRGLVVIAGFDPEFYGLSIDGTRQPFSLVVYNAHFENPFNEVAQLVPTALLRDFFRGTFTRADDYSGFNSRLGNAREQIPDHGTFVRHPTLGKYVINVGVGRKVIHGLRAGGSHEFRAWHQYRKAAIAYEVDLRTNDRRFASLRLAQAAQHVQAAYGIARAHGAQELFDYTSFLSSRVRYLGVSNTASRMDITNLNYLANSNEHDLIRRRQHLARHLKETESVTDSLEREVWQSVNRQLDLYDLFRMGYAYFTRGLTTPRVSTSESEESDSTELGDVEDAAFNRGGELMLRELYGAHALREEPRMVRAKFPILLIGEAIHSSRYDQAPAVMIDSFDMRDVVGGRAIQFGQGEMTDADVDLWRASVLTKIADRSGSIPELRLVERGMLPASLLSRFDAQKER